jgi:predicted nucleic acid-binding protein
MKIVSDSTVLIGLAKIKKTDLLRDIFHKIYIPEAVFREVAEEGNRRAGAKSVREATWIVKKTIADYTQVNLLMTVLEKGEAEVLVLAKEMQADLVLLDEEKARKSAVRAGFNVMGLIGILIVAKRLGFIRDIRTSIETLQKEKFRLSEKIMNMALKQAGELL